MSNAELRTEASPSNRDSRNTAARAEPCVLRCCPRPCVRIARKTARESFLVALDRDSTKGRRSCQRQDLPYGDARPTKAPPRYSTRKSRRRRGFIRFSKDRHAAWWCHHLNAAQRMTCYVVTKFALQIVDKAIARNAYAPMLGLVQNSSTLAHSLGRYK